MREHDMSQQIKEIRKHYGLSQQAFARLLGIGEASITLYEKGIAPTQANANLISSSVTGIDFHPVALNRVYKSAVIE